MSLLETFNRLKKQIDSYSLILSILIECAPDYKQDILRDLLSKYDLLKTSALLLDIEFLATDPDQQLGRVNLLREVTRLLGEQGKCNQEFHRHIPNSFILPIDVFNGWNSPYLPLLNTAIVELNHHLGLYSRLMAQPEVNSVMLQACIVEIEKRNLLIDHLDKKIKLSLELLQLSADASKVPAALKEKLDMSDQYQAQSSDILRQYCLVRDFYLQELRGRDPRDEGTREFREWTAAHAALRDTHNRSVSNADEYIYRARDALSRLQQARQTNTRCFHLKSQPQISIHLLQAYADAIIEYAKKGGNEKNIRKKFGMIDCFEIEQNNINIVRLEELASSLSTEEIVEQINQSLQAIYKARTISSKAEAALVGQLQKVEEYGFKLIPDLNGKNRLKLLLLPRNQLAYLTEDHQIYIRNLAALNMTIPIINIGFSGYCQAQAATAQELLTSAIRFTQAELHRQIYLEAASILGEREWWAIQGEAFIGKKTPTRISLMMEAMNNFEPLPDAQRLRALRDLANRNTGGFFSHQSAVTASQFYALIRQAVEPGICRSLDDLRNLKTVLDDLRAFNQSIRNPALVVNYHTRPSLSRSFS